MVLQRVYRFPVWKTEYHAAPVLSICQQPGVLPLLSHPLFASPLAPVSSFSPSSNFRRLPSISTDHSLAHSCSLSLSPLPSRRLFSLSLIRPLFILPFVLPFRPISSLASRTRVASLRVLSFFRLRFLLDLLSLTTLHPLPLAALSFCLRATASLVRLFSLARPPFSGCCLLLYRPSSLSFSLSFSSERNILTGRRGSSAPVRRHLAKLRRIG